MKKKRSITAACLLVGAGAGAALSGTAGAAERITEEDASARGRALCVAELEGRGILILPPPPHFTSAPSVYWDPPKARYYLEFTEHSARCEYVCSVDLDATGGDPTVRLAITPNHEGSRGRQELFECG